jgi:hypothetical protein
MPVKKSGNNHKSGKDHPKPSVQEQRAEQNTSRETITDAEKSETKIKNMEAYHPHGSHHGKKIKDYIFEFVMLFIAISAGFFMENMRESLSERHKEKEYIGSLMKDLAKDASNVQYRLKYNKNLIQGIDSLARLLLEIPVSEPNIPQLYNYTFNYLNQYFEFTPQDITIIQLKNSGGLRLVRDKSVSDSIIGYYSFVDNSIVSTEKFNIQFMNDNIKLEMLFLDFNAPLSKKMRIYDETKLIEFRNRALTSISLITWENYRLTQLQVKAASLLKYLRKAYQLSETD